MLRRTFYSMLMILALVSASKSASAHDSDIDLDDHTLFIDTDDSHDAVIVRVKPDRPDKIEVLVLQFDNPFDLFSFASEEEAIDAADDFRDRDYDLDDVDFIDIRSFGGDDWLMIDSALDIPTKMVAGTGDDFVLGGSHDDEIWGDDENVTSGANGGEDTLYGHDGEDEIHGGPQDDYIHGGLKDDDLFGDDGLDTLLGHSGDDIMDGGNHDDIMNGGSDHDEMFGGAGDDEMDGGSGNDTMWGGADDDEMEGGNGDDEMHGEGGHDDLFGQDGQDDLYGEAGNDLLDGSFDGEIDLMVGGSGLDEFVNRYYENRTYTYYRAHYYYVPRVVVDGFRVRIVYERQVVWVPVTGTYQYNFEVEIVQDYSNLDGDFFSPVEID